MSQPNIECSERDNFISQGSKMKDSPELYGSSNAGVQMDAIHFLEQYKSKMKWKQRGDRSIDLGSADGSTTIVLQKYLPPNYEALVGCDLNEKSVKFANDKYANHRISFQVLDIQGELPAKLRGSFDHVFSFYTIHWVHDQKKAFRNVFDLLLEDGDCLLLLLGRHPIYTMYLALAQSQRWATYLKDVHNIVSPYHDCQEPDILISKMMEDAGFKYVDVKCKQLTCEYNPLDAFKKIIVAIDPFGIPEELMKEFLVDCQRVLRDLQLLHTTESGVIVMRAPYNLLVVHARK
ncbi:hypothetical protein K1T71_011566 [Dendrolimus kikuchii]|uniref:Uncharacterized protein n=1 Tax=Dendrolimus kikuchii TaxID=765133 RepID=A0ACC1CP60_9NEOP|nr:hypothetical protein K1T71_011566 [Dendrolimus kikuchii]